MVTKKGSVCACRIWSKEWPGSVPVGLPNHVMQQVRQNFFGVCLAMDILTAHVQWQVAWLSTVSSTVYMYYDFLMFCPPVHVHVPTGIAHVHWQVV